MKKTAFLLTTLGLFIASCSSDDDNGPETLPITSEQVINLYAPQTGGQGQGEISGEFTKFDLATGEITTSTTEWDVAFRGTSIAINGGTETGMADEPERNGNAGLTVVTGTFNSVTTVQGLSFAQDSEGSFAIQTASEEGWYTYSGPPNHVISPIPGRVLVVRTRDGHYAKIEILSYYKDSPAEPELTSESRYYTFNYVYNPNEGENSLE
ncbi:MAG: HmuY family protein [Sediminicola sp.]